MSPGKPFILGQKVTSHKDSVGVGLYSQTVRFAVMVQDVVLVVRAEKRVCLKIEIHEIHEIHKMYEIHCLKIEIHEIH